MVTEEERLEGSNWGSSLVSLLKCPCIFPVGFQILCENQSLIFLKGPGAGEGPISDMPIGVRGAEGSSSQAGGTTARFWLGVGKVWGAGQPPAHLPLRGRSSVPSSEERWLSGVSKLRSWLPQFHIPQVGQTP